jgi:hypothetical protein
MRVNTSRKGVRSDQFLTSNEQLRRQLGIIANSGVEESIRWWNQSAGLYAELMEKNTLSSLMSAVAGLQYILSRFQVDSNAEAVARPAEAMIPSRLTCLSLMSGPNVLGEALKRLNFEPFEDLTNIDFSLEMLKFSTNTGTDICGDINLLDKLLRENQTPQSFNLVECGGIPRFQGDIHKLLSIISRIQESEDVLWFRAYGGGFQEEIARIAELYGYTRLGLNLQICPEKWVYDLFDDPGYRTLRHAVHLTNHAIFVMNGNRTEIADPSAMGSSPDRRELFVLPIYQYLQSEAEAMVPDTREITQRPETSLPIKVEVLPGISSREDALELLQDRLKSVYDYIKSILLEYESFEEIIKGTPYHSRHMNRLAPFYENADDDRKSDMFLQEFTPTVINLNKEDLLRDLNSPRNYTQVVRMLNAICSKVTTYFFNQEKLSFDENLRDKYTGFESRMNGLRNGIIDILEWSKKPQETCREFVNLDFSLRQRK